VRVVLQGSGWWRGKNRKDGWVAQLVVKVRFELAADNFIEFLPGLDRTSLASYDVNKINRLPVRTMIFEHQRSTGISQSSCSTRQTGKRDVVGVLS
jgi:hypothetical protein